MGGWGGESHVEFYLCDARGSIVIVINYVTALGGRTR